MKQWDDFCGASGARFGWGAEIDRRCCVCV